MLVAAPARFMDDTPQHHQTSRYRTTNLQQQRSGNPVLYGGEEDSLLEESMTAERHEHASITSTAVSHSSSTPHELLGLAGLPPTTTAATTTSSSGASFAAAPALPFPRGRHYPAHGHYLHHQQQQQQHQQQHLFSKHFGNHGAYSIGGALGGGGGGGPPGEDDFEFLRNILFDAGDGAAQAAQAAHGAHHHRHTLRGLGSAGVVVGGGASDAIFAPISAAKSAAFAAVHTSAPQALNPILSPPPAMSPTFVGAVTTTTGGNGENGEECMNSANFFRAGSVGGSGGGGNPLIGEGVSTGRYHVTEEERAQAADDVARCIWLARDELRDHLLSRLWEMWGTVEAEMDAVANNSNNNAPPDGSMSPSSSPSRQNPPRKSFNEALVDRLKATCKVVEMEIDAAKARGDDTTLSTGRPRQWRGSAALRNDVLARLESYKRRNLETCGNPGGSGHGRFTRMHCMDHLERMPAGGDGGVGSGHCTIGSVDNGGSGGELKHGLEMALEATRGAVKSELLSFGNDVSGRLQTNLGGARGAAGKSEMLGYDDDGNDRPSKVARRGLPAQTPDLLSAFPHGEGGGVSNRNAVAPVRRPKAGSASRDRGHPLAAVGVLAGQPAPPAATGGTRKKGAAAAASGGKKRKRSGNGRRCKHEGCLLHPHFGLTRPEYCSKHKLPGMFNVKGRRCIHQGCTRTPVYGKSGDPHPTYCAAHKPTGYVDIKNPTCREPTCFRQPSFGSASDRKATYCASHMLSGMVNVRRMLASFKSASLSAAAAGAAAGAAGPAGAGAGMGRRR